MSNSPTIGVVIPFHGPNKRSYLLLRRCLNLLNRQAIFPDQVLISLESSIPQESIDDLKTYLSVLEIRIDIVRNIFEPGIAQNCNFASSHLQTDYVHLLFYDDYLVDTEFYKKLQSRLLDTSPTWTVTASWSDCQTSHSGSAVHIPHLNKHLRLGVNTLGPPSSVFLRRECWQNLDERFSLFVDCDWYVRLITSYGPPQIMPDIWVGITTWSGQTQNSINRNTMISEYIQICSKQPRPNFQSVVSGSMHLRRRGSANQANGLLLGWIFSQLSFFCYPRANKI